MFTKLVNTMCRGGLFGGGIRTLCNLLSSTNSSTRNGVALFVGVHRRGKCLVLFPSYPTIVTKINGNVSASKRPSGSNTFVSIFRDSNMFSLGLAFFRIFLTNITFRAFSVYISGSLLQ